MNKPGAQILKRCFDVLLSLFLIILLVVPGLIISVIIIFLFKENPVFMQERIGKWAKPFYLYKFRTLSGNIPKNVSDNADKLSGFSKLLLRYKLNEIPQLFNILKGDMSFVGPRPDIKGYADELNGDDALILTVKPGLTGPATLKYRNEDTLLKAQKDPVTFNNNVIWPDKVNINRDYIKNWSFWKDIEILLITLFRS